VKESLKRCKDCKVIPGESLVKLHRLMVLDVRCKGRRLNKRKEQLGR